jgi:hypothetical protein
MADNDYISIEVDNEDLAILRLDFYAEMMRQRMKDLLDVLSRDGVDLLTIHVPNYTSYTIRHIDRSPVEEAEGGYDATVGIKAGTSYHPVYVNRGTGIFGPFIKRPYTAHNPSGRMWFYSEKYGRVIGIESVKGQRAQHFLYTTFKELQVFAQARMTRGMF